MKTKSIYVSASCLLILLMIGIGIYLSMAKASSQTLDKMENTAETQKIIAVLRDEGLRASSPNEVVNAIKRARVIAGASSFANADLSALTLSADLAQLLDALVELIDWEQPRRNDDFDPGYGLPIYPALSAIAVMRKQALPELVKVIENEDENSIKFKNALSGILLINNRDERATIEFLEDKAANADSETTKFKLLQACRLVRTKSL